VRLAWQNDDLILYHGCTDRSLHPANPTGIRVGTIAHGIDPTVGAQTTDFGPGFYATSSLHQAKCWADVRQARMNKRHPGIKAVVLRFDMKRNHLAELETLVFVTETSGFWPLVFYCRNQQPPHARLNSMQPMYDVVYGPLSAGIQPLIYKDCDQLGFHTAAAVNKIPAVVIEASGNPRFSS
jgi:hypothetical protein